MASIPPRPTTIADRRAEAKSMILILLPQVKSGFPISSEGLTKLENPNTVRVPDYSNPIGAVLIVASFVERVHKADGILFARKRSLRNIGNDTIDDCCDLSGES